MIGCVACGDDLVGNLLFCPWCLADQIEKASKKMTLDEAVALLVDEPDHSQTLAIAKELTGSSIETMFQSALDEFKKQDNSGQVIAGMLYVVAIAVRARQISTITI